MNWRRDSAANTHIRQESIIPHRKEKGNKIHYGTCHITKIDAFKRNGEMLGVRSAPPPPPRGERCQVSIHPSSGFSTHVTWLGIKISNTTVGVMSPKLPVYYLKQICSNCLYVLLYKRHARVTCSIRCVHGNTRLWQRGAIVTRFVCPCSECDGPTSLRDAATLQLTGETNTHLLLPLRATSYR
jgi:hypothetical protein